MAKNDFQYGGWNNYTLQCGKIVTLISPGGSTLQCGRWLWDDMPWNLPKRLPYWNSTSGFEFDHITAVDLNQAPPKQSAVCSTCIIPALPVNCQFIWMACAFGMSATQPISG